MDERNSAGMSEPRPALVLREAERINVKELVSVGGDTLAVDTEALYRYIGDVTVEKMRGKDGTTVKRWFAWTLVDTNLGPFPNRVKAIRALLAANHLREAKISETVPPLFQLP